MTGKVDHLRTTLLEASEVLVTRRYLYLYDSVPGGTGYLKQLMTRPDDFRAIFEKALRHMQGCGCNSDATRDGCYRCVYAYRDASRMAKTSRNHAVAMFTDITSHWPSLEAVGSVGDIKGNALLESELEAMFVCRLERMAQDAGGTFRAITVGGKKGYFIKLGKDAPAWEVEAQVWLNELFMMPGKTRADFLLRPKAAGQDVKPVAIYVDGWETHQDRIASDMEKRLAAVRTGQCLVWSLSFHDLSNEFAANPADRTAHLWQPFAGLEMGYDKYFPGVDCSQARSLAAAPLPRVLQEYLTKPNAALWNSLPGILSLSTLLAPASNRSPESIREYLQQAGGQVLVDHLEELGDGFRAAMFAKDGLAFVAAMPKAPDVSRIRPLVLLADTNSASLEMRQCWNTAVRLLNLLQFSAWVHVAPHSNPDIPLPRGTDERAAPSDDWTGIYDLTSSELHGLLDLLKGAGVTPPVVGYELTQGVRIVAEAELAWPDRKVCLALSQYDSAFSNEGWKVAEMSATITNHNTLLDKLKV